MRLTDREIRDALSQRKPFKDNAMIKKVDYVRAQKQTRLHHCHWPGCEKQVPPAMWGCRSHWFKLPKNFRAEIWDTYRPGQEIDMNPSSEYLAVADAIKKWCSKAPH